jgi:hypothetical protein
MPQLLPTITSREREGYAKETQIVQDNPNVRGTAGAINATSWPLSQPISCQQSAWYTQHKKDDSIVTSRHWPLPFSSTHRCPLSWALQAFPVVSYLASLTFSVHPVKLFFRHTLVSYRRHLSVNNLALVKLPSILLLVRKRGLINWLRKSHKGRHLCQPARDGEYCRRFHSCNLSSVYSLWMSLVNSDAVRYDPVQGCGSRFVWLKSWRLCAVKTKCVVWFRGLRRRRGLF